MFAEAVLLFLKFILDCFIGGSQNQNQTINLHQFDSVYYTLFWQYQNERISLLTRQARTTWGLNNLQHLSSIPNFSTHDPWTGAPEEFKYFIQEFIYLKNNIFSRISMLQHVIVIYASILHVADQQKILNCKLLDSKEIFKVYLTGKQLRLQFKP